MNRDEVAGSLAAQAAAWVPPWSRRPDGDEAVDAPALAALVDEPEPASEIAAADDPPVQPFDDVSPEPAAEAISPTAETDDRPIESPDIVALISDEELRGAIEAILLVVDEPVSEVVLAQVVEQPTERISSLLEALAEEYGAAERGFELRRAAGGWRLYTRPRFAAYVEKFVLDGQQVRLTQAALETLAVVAYKQPVTRARISAIRGVNCDGVVRTLMSRGLIEECGSEPDSGAFLYRTTTLFLEKLGLDDLGQLPPLAPFLPDDVDAVADGTG
jgi:segregation and condensation protein B